jgi:DNA-binding transcriptional regulator PaaX
VARKGYARIGHDATDRIAEIGVTAYAVFGVLARRANRERRCWPSVATIAKTIGVTPRCVRTALATLQDAGLITVQRRYNDPVYGKQPNLYILHDLEADDEWTYSDTRIPRARRTP